MKSIYTSKLIAWNTNALYSGMGQRIAAVPVNGGVFFVDVDRGTYGYIQPSDDQFDSGGRILSQQHIMDAYNRGKYSYDIEDSSGRAVGDYAIQRALRDTLESIADLIDGPTHRATKRW